MKGSSRLLLFGLIFLCFGIAAAAQYSGNHLIGYLIVAILFFIALALDIIVVIALLRKGQ